MPHRSLPVPSDFFYCPPLPAKEKAYLTKKAKDSAKTVIESARSAGGRIRWTPAGKYRGVQMYSGEPVSVSSENIEYACGVTSVKGTIEEVAEFFDFSTTTKVREFAHQFSDDMMDSVVLYNLTDHEDTNNTFSTHSSKTGAPIHQITVRWSVMETPSPIIKNRDFCTLECHDVFCDSMGRRGWVRSFHSVKLACCPDLQDELGLVRGSIYHSGYVFVESNRPGYLDAIHIVEVNMKGNLILPKSLSFAATKRRVATVAMLNQHLQQRRLHGLRFLSDGEIAPKTQRSHCFACHAKFNLVVRKAGCRVCGEVFCWQCAVEWKVDPAMHGFKKVRICTECSSKTSSCLSVNDSASDRSDDDFIRSSMSSSQFRPVRSSHNSSSFCYSSQRATSGSFVVQEAIRPNEHFVRPGTTLLNDRAPMSHANHANPRQSEVVASGRPNTFVDVTAHNSSSLNKKSRSRILSASQSSQETSSTASSGSEDRIHPLTSEALEQHNSSLMGKGKSSRLRVSQRYPDRLTDRYHHRESVYITPPPSYEQALMQAQLESRRMETPQRVNHTTNAPTRRLIDEEGAISEIDESSELFSSDDYNKSMARKFAAFMKSEHCAAEDYRVSLGSSVDEPRGSSKADPLMGQRETASEFSDIIEEDPSELTPLSRRHISCDSEISEESCTTNLFESVITLTRKQKALRHQLATNPKASQELVQVTEQLKSIYEQLSQLTFEPDVEVEF